jgi:alpha-glucosidase/alpha-D-xyloside xylohydrolase
MPISRRTALKGLGAVGATTLVGSADAKAAQDGGLKVAGRAVEVSVTSVSPQIVRVSVVAIEDGKPQPIPSDGSLVKLDWGAPVLKTTSLTEARTVVCGDSRVTVSADPLTIRIEANDGRLVQRLRVDAQAGSLAFDLGDGPVLGLGEGGPQFDRRGSVDRMRSGQGGYRLRTHGGRVPIPWLVGTSGWAMFIHRPYGSFDLTGGEGKYLPRDAASSLPLDVFVVTSREPAKVMAEYARLTGLPEMPPLWSLGYQQSHRTLASRDEILEEARTFRERKLPCDTMIYLGTGFCPSGWNTGHGSWTFNSAVFPDPKADIEALRALHFRVVPHIVIRARSVAGSVRDPFDPAVIDESAAGSYWNAHRKVEALFDGWWPDEGDPLDIPSRLNRIRMYYEGEQLDRPDARPFALHRNGYAGMQRYAAFLWSGDVYSTWETLKTHLPIAVNTGLTGIPYWGTDIGGFVPTKEFTGELYVRWFQFAAFCPSFRSHGRTWKLRLPWGWNTGTIGVDEIRTYGEAANPGPEELHNAEVEPICRKYLELRYRLMPYLYSAVYEGHVTGLPIMRSLWLHHADDPTATARGDEYLWGRDLLVAPVVEKGATSRKLYLPRGAWYDFWTEEKLEGGKEVDRPVDLATTPLYARAGAIIPLGPVKQYTAEPVDAPTTLCIYPGADGDFLLYDDDGITYRHRQGDWMGIRMAWDDGRKRLTLKLAEGSKMRAPLARDFEVRLVPGKATRAVKFDGNPAEVQF